jgi:hypothetical protein
MHKLCGKSGVGFGFGAIGTVVGGGSARNGIEVDVD